ncbi:MAG TPA: hypothetical protein PLE45_10350 [Spirochaetota bacterium]|nr:hypothetical protein [Spirochaetota bacterium]HOL57581.1 hypothetical protein [Spirochaetota bacterium]HPP05168.1 hypothetical protein [Spirochaetota bacterium]
MKIESIHNGGVTLECIDNRVFIKGSIETKIPGEFMTQFFEELHNQVIKEKIKELYVDITNLKFLNSNGIKELAKWIMKILTVQEEDRYKVIFICDRKMAWQETSITTLTFLNPNLILKQFIN